MTNRDVGARDQAPDKVSEMASEKARRRVGAAAARMVGATAARRVGASATRRAGAAAGRVVVVGDLALDVVLAPGRTLEHGTDVPGMVALRQGGSAANTARWLARLGTEVVLVCAVGRDVTGRALVAALEGDGVLVRAAHPRGKRTARIGMVVDRATGERSFVADRGAADGLAPEDLRAAWFARAVVLHLPAYSLLGEPLGRAALAAIGLARAGGARISVDLASAAPLLASGRAGAHELIAAVAPDLLLTNTDEAAAFLGVDDPRGLLAFAPIAIVKRGAAGATVVASQVTFDVPTRRLAPADTTGAGDAFDAGFLAAWLAAGRARSTEPAVLRGACVAGNRTAARQLARPRPELNLSPGGVARTRPASARGGRSGGPGDR